MTTHRRVWVVSELYYPEETSTGYFLTHIAERLATRYDVRALCSQPTYSARGRIAPWRERRHGVDIIRCRSTRLNKDVLPLRALNMLTITGMVGWTLLRGLRRGDAVLVVTNPPALPFVTVLAARLRGARVTLLVHDVYPEVLVATGAAEAGSATVRVIGALTRWLYRHVDRIVVLGRDMHAIVAAKVPDPARRVVIIPNWGDVVHIRPVPRAENRLLARLGLGDKFVVQAMGNMGRTHGIETLAAAAERLRGRVDIHFLFIGWGGRRRWLERTVVEQGLTNVTVLPPCPREELADYLNACDVAAIAFIHGMAGVSVPSRMYNVFSAGKPVLAVADPESELARVVTEAAVGWVVTPEDSEALARQIAEIADARGTIPAIGARARALAEREYSQGHVTAAYLPLFEETGPP